MSQREPLELLEPQDLAQLPKNRPVALIALATIRTIRAAPIAKEPKALGRNHRGNAPCLRKQRKSAHQAWATF